MAQVVGRRTAAVVACLAALVIAATGCTSTATVATPGSTAQTTSKPPTSTTSSAEPTSSTPPPPPPSCAQTMFAALTPEQRVGQLIMVALQPGQQASVAQLVATSHVGSVFLLGGWDGGATSVQSAIAAVDQSATAAATGAVKIWTAVDQEGGQVQQLKGSGFNPLPDARAQAGLPLPELTAQAQGLGAQLRAAGIDINLAPVADVVPASIGTANGPIGKFNRQYGATAEQATPPMLAFAAGMTAAGVLPTAKHFPGIGRISQNTDDSAVGITDSQLTADDPSLGTFKAAIAQGVPLMMVSSALYPQLDPANQAMFSLAIITGLLRGTLGFHGVVITDDVGAAKSVAAVPVAERATRFVEAGGDVVLSAVPSQAPVMTAALLASGATDSAFQGKINASVMRVLTAKDSQKLLPCSA